MLTLEWPGSIILFPKTFIPLGSTLTASVTVDGFEIDVTYTAVQAACILIAALAPASSLVTPIFSGLAVYLHSHQSMLALVKLIVIQILLCSGRNYWFLYFINNLLTDKC